MQGVVFFPVQYTPSHDIFVLHMKKS